MTDMAELIFMCASRTLAKVSQALMEGYMQSRWAWGSPTAPIAKDALSIS